MNAIEARIRPILTPVDFDVAWNFWLNVDKTTNCWLWKACCDDDGYGIFTISRHKYRAHRVAFAIHYKEDPGNVILMHSCDVPACVNPEHLVRGTCTKNNLKTFEVGHNSHVGELNTQAKLRREHVIEMRAMYDSGITIKVISEKFNWVNRSAIEHVVHRRRWKHI